MDSLPKKLSSPSLLCIPKSTQRSCRTATKANCVQNYAKDLHKAACDLALEGVWELWCKKINFKSRASSFFRTSEEVVITVYLFHSVHADLSDHYWEIISGPTSAMNTSHHLRPPKLSWKWSISNRQVPFSLVALLFYQGEDILILYKHFSHRLEAVILQLQILPHL